MMFSYPLLIAEAQSLVPPSKGLRLDGFYFLLLTCYFLLITCYSHYFTNFTTAVMPQRIAGSDSVSRMVAS